MCRSVWMVTRLFRLDMLGQTDRLYRKYRSIGLYRFGSIYIGFCIRLQRESMEVQDCTEYIECIEMCRYVQIGVDGDGAGTKQNCRICTIVYSIYTNVYRMFVLCTELVETCRNVRFGTIGIDSDEFRESDSD